MRVEKVLSHSGYGDDPNKGRRQKISRRKAPKKADHKHVYEPVLLSGLSKYTTFDAAAGFIAQRRTITGRRCLVCGRLEAGLPGSACVKSADERVSLPHPFGIDQPWDVTRIKPEYAEYPIVRVKNLDDYNHLEEEGD